MIRKNITLVGWYKILYFESEKGVVSGVLLCRYIISPVIILSSLVVQINQNY